jgi:hypothetical protein
MNRIVVLFCSVIFLKQLRYCANAVMEAMKIQGDFFLDNGQIQHLKYDWE